MGKSWDLQLDGACGGRGGAAEASQTTPGATAASPLLPVRAARAVTWLEGGGARGVDARRQVSALGGVRGRRGFYAPGRSLGSRPRDRRGGGAGPGPAGGDGRGGGGARRTTGPGCADSWKLGRLWTSWHTGYFSPKC